MPTVPTMPAAMPMPPAMTRFSRPSGSYTSTNLLNLNDPAPSAVRTWDEIHGLERELVLTHAAGAAQCVRDRAGHRDDSDLTQRSGIVVRRDQRDVDLGHLVEAQEVGGVEVRLGCAPTDDVDAAVQQIAQPEDHAALDLTSH